jgi:hypothetical protein
MKSTGVKSGDGRGHPVGCRLPIYFSLKATSEKSRQWLQNEKEYRLIGISIFALARMECCAVQDNKDILVTTLL